MKLRLKRRWETVDATIGELFLDDEPRFCYTCEDVSRLDPTPETPWNDADVAQVKIPAHTAIPPGTYPIVWHASHRFGRVLPKLMNVPGFTDILIHNGNTAADTSGCILVGATRWPNGVGQSMKTLDALLEKMQAARGTLSITITEEWEGV